MADGQVTQGSEIVKPNVRKVRRITDDVIGGFAGVAPSCCTREQLQLLSQMNVHITSHVFVCPQAPRQTRSHCLSGSR